jgi:frataxin-like iron-binding protein CyaY
MIDEHEFKKHTEEALKTIQGDLVLAGDDYGFHSSLHGGAITISFDRPPGKFTVTPDVATHQLKVGLVARTYKLDWDIVENAFVHVETHQTLKEMLEQAISKHLKQDVQL